MSADTPNRLCVGKHDSSYRAHFGAIYGAIPMHHVKGLGHQEHIKVNFHGGLSLELTRAAAIELARRLPEAIASLPIDPDADCSGAVWTGEGA
jgi:hypothetical protein